MQNFKLSFLNFPFLFTLYSLLYTIYNILMRYIDFEINNGKKNMQIDSDLLDIAIKNKLTEPIFRFYAWSPACVSLGRNQSADFLDMEFLKSKNIDVVRRLTGGRALLHDKELTYSYICPISSLENGESVANSYKEISQILINGFEKLGIKLEFGKNNSVPHSKPDFDRKSRVGLLSHRHEVDYTLNAGQVKKTKFDYCMSISTGADLSFEGKKLIGSAQFRKEGYILQHGSILFNYDKGLIEKLFDEKVDEVLLTCLDYINPKLTCNEVINALCEAFADSEPLIK